MAKAPQRAGVYCRLSYAEDGTVEKVDRQEADCYALAERLGWKISKDHVFKDNNRSAWQRSRKRPGWDAMLASIETGEIDAVIVWHGDRLLRQPYDLEKLINTADAKGIRIGSVAGTRDLDNPDDRYILRIEAAGFCRSSDDTSRRVKRGIEKRTEAGLPRPGGTRAFGFERDNITHRPAEVEVIREAAERLLAGQSQYSVIAWMNTVSTTSTGGRWKPLAFKQMMTRLRIAGLVEHKTEHKTEIVQAAWEPVLDIETWELVKAVLSTTQQQAPPQEHGIKYLLSWIAVCGTCQGPLVVRNQAGRKMPNRAKVYGCTNLDCGRRVTRAVAHLDAYVSGRVLRILNDPKFLDRLSEARNDPGLAKEIIALEQRKTKAKHQLENLADFPEVDAEIVARSLASFDRKIKELRDRQATTARQRMLAKMAGITREQWEAEPLDVRRTTIKELLRVEVLPTVRKGRGFDPGCVRVTPIEEDTA